MANIQYNPSGHRKRMRLRFTENYSLRNFSEEEILEMMLYYVFPQKDTAVIAKELLAKFGKLSAVLDASPELLTEVSGIGEQTAIYLKFLKALIVRYQNSKNAITFLANDVNAVGQFCASLIGNEETEVFAVITADANRQITGYKIFPAGSYNSVSVDTRMLMAYILQSNAQFVILTHNHPNSTLLPSQQDQNFTVSLNSLLLPFGIGIIDHFIVFNDLYLSFSQQNLL